MRREGAILALTDAPTLKHHWRIPPVDVRLEDTDIHLWRASLELTFAQYSTAISSLTSEDLARAAEYRFQRDRSRFIAARATLRGILGCYLGCAARNVQFTDDGGTKPVVVGDSDHKIHFNLSHAGDLMICAVARHDVGLDIERSPSNTQREEVLRLMFPSVALKQDNENSRNREFLKLWTRTEAMVKLDGCGLAGAGTQLCAISPADPNLTFEYFEPAHEYCGAVAFRGRELRLHCWLWSLGSTD